jgi:hemerythrin
MTVMTDLLLEEPFLQWKDDFSVGVASIDEQHRHMVDIVVSLYNSMTGGMSDDCFRGMFESLVDCTRAHFRFEESFFERTVFPRAEKHRREHEDLLRHVELFSGEIVDRSDAVKSRKMMEFLKCWLLDHIGHEDKLLGAHLNAQGIR